MAVSDGVASTKWRDRLRPASFRGVPFYVETANAVIGRRVVLHEYPLRDKPYAEDLGKKAQTFRITAFVLGDDYMDQRDALIQAIETEGAGELIHPYLGTKTVTVSQDVEVAETGEEGGLARFTLTFIEAGEILYPSASTDTDAKIEAKEQSFREKLQSWFADTFSIEGVADYVSQDALDAVNELLELESMALGATGWIRATVGSNLNGLLPENLLNSMAKGFPLAAGLSQLIQNAKVLDELARFELSGVTSTLSKSSSATSSGSGASGGGSGSSGSSGTTLDPIKTPDRITMEQNREALNLFVKGEVVARQIVESTASEVLDTVEGAEEVRTWIVSRVDELIFAETFGDEPAQALVELRDAVLEKIEAETPQLPRIETVRLKAVQPAVVLAHRLYGSDWLARELDRELCTRNRVRRPLMMPADVDLEAVVYDN